MKLNPLNRVARDPDAPGEALREMSVGSAHRAASRARLDRLWARVHPDRPLPRRLDFRMVDERSEQ